MAIHGILDKATMVRKKWNLLVAWTSYQILRVSSYEQLPIYVLCGVIVWRGSYIGRGVCPSGTV
jgi:hypothetical protein